MVLSSLNLYFIHKFFVLYWKFYTQRNQHFAFKDNNSLTFGRMAIYR